MAQRLTGGPRASSRSRDPGTSLRWSPDPETSAQTHISTRQRSTLRIFYARSITQTKSVFCPTDAMHAQDTLKLRSRMIPAEQHSPSTTIHAVLPNVV